jgi:hypothetical protein
LRGDLHVIVLHHEPVVFDDATIITINTAARMLESMSTLFEKQAELLEKYKRST